MIDGFDELRSYEATPETRTRIRMKVMRAMIADGDENPDEHDFKRLASALSQQAEVGLSSALRVLQGRTVSRGTAESVAAWLQA